MIAFAVSLYQEQVSVHLGWLALSAMHLHLDYFHPFAYFV